MICMFFVTFSSRFFLFSSSFDPLGLDSGEAVFSVKYENNNFYMNLMKKSD